jgi:HlyD family secretion protein
MPRRHVSTGTVVFCLIVVITGCSQPAATTVAPTAAAQTVQIEPTYVVQRGQVVQTLVFDGQIAPLEEMPLYFRTPGYVKQVHVEQGDAVQAGDLLAELETDDLLNQIAQAELNLSSAQLLLSEAEASLQQEIALAELGLSLAETRLGQAKDANAYAVAQSELSLELAQEQLARTQALQAAYTASIVRTRVGIAQAEDQVARAEIEVQKSLERPGESAEAQDAYARELQQAKWDLEIARAQYDQTVADRDAYEYDLSTMSLAVEQAETELAQLEGGADPLLALEIQRAQQVLDGLKRGVDPALANEVERAQLVVEQLKARLHGAELRAPFDGTAVNVWIRPGDAVVHGQVAVLVADLDHFYLETSDLGQFDVALVRVGQRVYVTLDAFPDTPLTGRVSEVALRGTDGQDSRVLYTSRVSLEATDTVEMRWGMTGVARIDLVPR